MGIKTVPHPPYGPDLALCDFWSFPKLKEKLRDCRYETIEEMKEAVTKVIDMLTQEDFHGAFKKLLERYNKCIVAGGDYFEGDESFMCVLSIKVPIRKKSGNLFNEPRILFFFLPFLISSQLQQINKKITIEWGKKKKIVKHKHQNLLTTPQKYTHTTNKPPPLPHKYFMLH